MAASRRLTSRSTKVRDALRIAAPSDLPGARAGRFLVGGRVASVKGSTVHVVDAFSIVRAQLLDEAGVAEGDFVVVEGRWTGRELARAECRERYPASFLGRGIASDRSPSERGRLHRRSAARPASELARLCFGGVGVRLAARARAFAVIRDYFREQGFVEVDTPQRVRAPALDVHIAALRAEGGWLVTSPEFHMKRLLVGGMPRIFQLSHCFRGDEHGPLHEPEFMLLEWYRAFAKPESVLRDTERIAVRVVQALAGTTRLRVRGRNVDVTPPFERLTVREAFRAHAGVQDAAALAARDEQRFFRLLVERVEPALARCRRPVFLCEYPISQASLAKASEHDPSVAERFELYLAGVELSNGFGELTDVEEQRRRFARDRRQRRGKRRPVYPVDERFLSALSEGMPPAAGNALGVDRLVLLALGAETLADVQAFPEAWR
jgi:lysyl-tRNA synthetase class 2